MGGCVEAVSEGFGGDRRVIALTVVVMARGTISVVPLLFLERDILTTEIKIVLTELQEANILKSLFAGDSLLQDFDKSFLSYCIFTDLSPEMDMSTRLWTGRGCQQIRIICCAEH